MKLVPNHLKNKNRLWKLKRILEIEIVMKSKFHHRIFWKSEKLNNIINYKLHAMRSHVSN